MPSPRLKKALAQHHLTDGRLCHPLISFLRPFGQRVLEIGPGGGALTAELLRAGARVWAWELDPEWAFSLRRDLASPAPGLRGVFDRDLISRTGASPVEEGSAPGPGGGPGLDLVVGDALEVPWGRLPAPTLAAGNLPYNVATAIVSRVLRHPRRVPRAAFLVQKEVADRLAAEPGSSDYGALSVLVAARAEVHLLGRVKAGSFRPPPKVDGAFVGLVARPAPHGMDEAEMERFEETVHQAFSQRRKTLRNSLGSAWGKGEAERVLESAGVSPRARAQELALDDFLRLHATRERALRE